MPTISEQEVRQLVRQAVERVLGHGPHAIASSAPSPAAPRASGKRGRMIYQDDVRAVAEGEQLRIPAGARLTPLAQELALQRRIKIVVSAPSSTDAARSGASVIALGADHGGYTLKENLKAYLVELGYTVTDVGTNSSESVDYPDFAYSVAKLVADGQAARGIMIDGAGIGSCMVANKVPGVRASLCYDVSSASNAREHNDANVLTLGGSLIGTNLARQIVKTWLTTEFGGGRHARRVEKIIAVEKRYGKS